MVFIRNLDFTTAQQGRTLVTGGLTWKPLRTLCSVLIAGGVLEELTSRNSGQRRTTTPCTNVRFRPRRRPRRCTEPSLVRSVRFFETGWRPSPITCVHAAARSPVETGFGSSQLHWAAVKCTCCLVATCREA